MSFGTIVLHSLPSNHLQEAIQLDPEYVKAYVRLASAYAEQGNLVESVSMLEKKITELKRIEEEKQKAEEAKNPNKKKNNLAGAFLGKKQKLENLAKAGSPLYELTKKMDDCKILLRTVRAGQDALIEAVTVSEKKEKKKKDDDDTSDDSDSSSDEEDEDGKSVTMNYEKVTEAISYFKKALEASSKQASSGTASGNALLQLWLARGYLAAGNVGGDDTNHTEVGRITQNLLRGNKDLLGM